MTKKEKEEELDWYACRKFDLTTLTNGVDLLLNALYEKYPNRRYAEMNMRFPRK
jgi:hypothetical protein